MSIKKFKKKGINRKKIIKIVGAFMIVGIVISGISYAVYQRENEVTFIDVRVGDFRVYLDNLMVSSTSNSITLDYFIPDPYDLKPTVTCKYGTTPRNYTSTASKVSNEKCELTGLTPETVYYFQVCARNKLNQEECIDGAEMTSYGAPTISDISATSTNTSITLRYNVEGKIDNLTCKYGTSNGNYASTSIFFDDSICNIKTLNPGTTYYYQVCASNDVGENCKTGNYRTISKLEASVNIGDYISMTPTSKSYTIPKSLTGYTRDQTINPSELNLWRVIRKNEDGTVDVVSEYSSRKVVYFEGITGYKKLVGSLNTIAAQYINTNYVQKTRNIGYDGQIEICENQDDCPSDTGYLTDTNLVRNALKSGETCDISGDCETSGYWVSSRYSDEIRYEYGGYAWGSGSVSVSVVYPFTIPLFGKLATSSTSTSYGDKTVGLRIRPILTLKGELTASGAGSSADSPKTLVSD